jgi:DNA-binding protein HU-beta
MNQGGITMNKTEFVEAIAEEAGLTKTDAAKAVKAFTDVVVKAMKDGDKVQLVGFGTFEATKRPERQGINPATKEKITIAAATVPKFKAGAALKKELN